MWSVVAKRCLYVAGPVALCASVAYGVSVLYAPQPPSDIRSVASHLRELQVSDIADRTDRAIRLLSRPGSWKLGTMCAKYSGPLKIIPDSKSAFTVHVVANHSYATAEEFREICERKFAESGFERVPGFEKYGDLADSVVHSTNRTDLSYSDVKLDYGALCHMVVELPN